MNCPDQLQFWTADAIAECLPYKDDENHTIYKKLWSFVSEAENPTPPGGDPGETPGAVETPDGRLNPKNDDKAPHWWDKLTHEEQIEISRAYNKEALDDQDRIPIPGE